MIPRSKPLSGGLEHSEEAAYDLGRSLPELKKVSAQPRAQCALAFVTRRIKNAASHQICDVSEHDPSSSSWLARVMRGRCGPTPGADAAAWTVRFCGSACLFVWFFCCAAFSGYVQLLERLVREAEHRDRNTGGDRDPRGRVVRDVRRRFDAEDLLLEDAPRECLHARTQQHHDKWASAHAQAKPHARIMRNGYRRNGYRCGHECIALGPAQDRPLRPPSKPLALMSTQYGTEACHASAAVGH